MSRIRRRRLARLATLAVTAGLFGLAPPGRSAERDLLVASLNTNSVLRYDGVTGTYLGPFVRIRSGGLRRPVALTFGPEGNLYVSEGIHPDGRNEPENRVLRYDGATGAFIDQFTPPVPTVFPVGIQDILFGPDGHLYGSTQGTVFRADGTTGAFDTFVELGPQENCAATTVLCALGLTFGPDGNLYVGNFHAGQVWRYDGTTGAFIDVFAEAPIAPPTGCVGYLAFGPDANLYVSLPCDLDDVLRFDGVTGDYLGSFFNDTDPHPVDPYVFVFGPDGNFYVSSSETDEVLRYDGTTGAFIDVFADGGGLDNPAGLVFVPEPGQVLLGGTGALVLAAARRRRAG